MVLNTVHLAQKWYKMVPQNPTKSLLTIIDSRYELHFWGVFGPLYFKHKA